jgi:hypothetical protein
MVTVFLMILSAAVVVAWLFTAVYLNNEEKKLHIR